MLSADDFYAPIDALVDRRLAELGFVQIRRANWAKQDCKSARPLFFIQHYKGKISAPVWGYSLNFVPHINNSGAKLYWHRTLKSARLDVSPFDALQKEAALNWFARPEDHAMAVERGLGGALERAVDFFERYRSIPDLLPLFERLRKHKSDALGYWNFTNLPLAHAFSLRVAGDAVAGRRLLDEFVHRGEISASVKRELDRRFEAAHVDDLLFG
ncbi:MAG: hypothetical protein KJO82_01330 [Gammaproteobacteria bacterium]|nr:hypothetical protein [Gammaproteobacteria bacterium]